MSISDEILKSIEIMIKSAFNKRKTTEVYIGNISSVNSDGYTVKYNGKEIKIKTKATDVFKRGDVVKFCEPQNKFDKRYFVVDIDVMKRYVDERIEELVK